MQLKIYQIDAFTQHVFDGNYAAVIVLEQWLEDAIMLKIANENNVSETAFVVRQRDNVFDIRWFSPKAEIDFCGHATLASAFVLFKQHSEFDSIIFKAPAIGQLTLQVSEQGLITMRSPIRAPKPLTEPTPDALVAGLKKNPIEVLKSQQAYFAIYDSAETIANLQPDFDALKQLAPFDVVVTAPSNQAGIDFESRYFWPANGTNEDPATGSIHAGLAPYWAAKFDKNQLIAKQGSDRKGTIYCKVNQDDVEISGYAVQYMLGMINI